MDLSTIDRGLLIQYLQNHLPETHTEIALPNIFTKEVSTDIIERIRHLKADSQPKLGTMSIAQMLAHCSVTYEMTNEDIHPKSNFLMKLILKTFIRKIVKMKLHLRLEFSIEKKRLVDYIIKTQQLGKCHFDENESHPFGALNKAEWNNCFINISIII